MKKQVTRITLFVAAILLAAFAARFNPHNTAQASLGTLHEVWNEEWTTSSAISSTTLITPTVDTTYTVFFYGSATGTPTGTNADSFAPYFTWTDDVGNEQLGDSTPNVGGGYCTWGKAGTGGGDCGAGYEYGPLLHELTANGDVPNAGPNVVIFPVRVKANTSLVFAMPVLNPDNLSAHVSVQVMGW